MTRPLALLALLLGLPALAARAQGSGVTVATDPPLPVAGIGLDVSAVFDDPVEAASLFLRPTGSTGDYAEVAGTPSPDGRVFSGTVPGSLVTPSGLDVFVVYVRDGETQTFPTDDPEAQPLRFPVLVPRVRAAVTPPPRAHRMVSIPFAFRPELAEIFGGDFGEGTLASVFEDDYGPYDPTRWRVLRWDTAAEVYREAEVAVPRVEPGHAFWLVTSSGAGFDVEGGLTPGFAFDDGIAEVPVVVRLEPGWSQIGNPYTFPLAWASVENADLVSEPVAFEGDYVPGQTILRPWEGYFVENRTGAPVDLRFRVPTGAPPDAAPPFAARYRERLGSGGYLVQLSAEADGARDRHTYLGVSAQPAGLDLAKAPPVAHGLRLTVEAEGRAWAGRILSPAEPPAWTLRLEADAWAQPRPVTVTLTEHGPPPAGRVLVVRDLDSGEALAVGGGSFTVRVGGAEGARRFAAALVEAAEVPALAPERSLAPVRPNPFRPGREAAVLRYHLAAGAEGALEVFDLLGRRVRTLVAGEGDGAWHTLRWDGRDDAGRPLPAGLYLLRLRAGGAAHTQKITLLR